LLYNHLNPPFVQVLEFFLNQISPLFSLSFIWVIISFFKGLSFFFSYFSSLGNSVRICNFAQF
ncbi:hypothetical protein ACHAXS_000099, partial [Conticribra weissflogii]